MKKTLKAKRPVSAEHIAKLANQGEDVSSFFTNKGDMMPPIHRVNVDFTQPMLNELDAAARELNISRQAVVQDVFASSVGPALSRSRRPPTPNPPLGLNVTT